MSGPVIGTPFSATATRVLLCGSGELGKEVAIELQRLGCEVIACDRYNNAPAMQVADRSHTLSMLDGEALRRVIELEKPDYIVPEIEAIATAELVALEQQGYTVVPTAKAAQLTRTVRVFAAWRRKSWACLPRRISSAIIKTTILNRLMQLVCPVWLSRL